MNVRSTAIAVGAVLALLGAGCTPSTPSSGEDAAMKNAHVVNTSAGLSATCPDAWVCTEHLVDLISAQRDGSAAGLVKAATTDVATEHAAYVAKRAEPIVASQTTKIVKEGTVDRGQFSLIEATSASGRKEMSMVVTQTMSDGSVVVCQGSYPLADQDPIAKEMRAFCESVDVVN